MDRRVALIGMGSLAAGSALGVTRAAGGPAAASPRLVASDRFPRTGDFDIPEGLTFLNSASVHPMPVAVRDVVRRYAEARARPEVEYAPWPVPDVGSQVKAHFAALINAKPSEIAFIPNTSTGENLVVAGLDIAKADGNVVTDALHFEGALIHLQSLQRERGLDLRIVRPREHRIELADLERVVDRRTKLVELSLVSMYNGFQHDLKAVCDLAHAHGAYVYADIIQAAGATPIDVKASGVDFCACAAFKWLMGDFGLGFLYVREDLLDRVMRRTQYGYDQVTRLETHFMPYDAPAASPLTWELGTDATAHVQVGSLANGTRAALYESLPYVRKLGVEQIEAHRQPLLMKLRAEMPRLGFELATPPDSKSALITFGMKDGKRVAERLRAAKVSARLSDHWMRVSPSVFNTEKDIERLLEALA
jgi:selenocysteine lyase/cysteine desulfurase